MCKILVPTFLTLMFQYFHCVYIWLRLQYPHVCMYVCMYLSIYLCYSSSCGWLTFQYLHICFKTLNTMYMVTICITCIGRSVLQFLSSKKVSFCGLISFLLAWFICHPQPPQKVTIYFLSLVCLVIIKLVKLSFHCIICFL